MLIDKTEFSNLEFKKKIKNKIKYMSMSMNLLECPYPYKHIIPMLIVDGSVYPLLESTDFLNVFYSLIQFCPLPLPLPLWFHSVQSKAIAVPLWLNNTTSTFSTLDPFFFIIIYIAIYILILFYFTETL